MSEISRKFYDATKKPFVDYCLAWGISANFVTILNHVITLTFGLYFFSLGTYLGMILGLIICFINGYLDYLDGDLARITEKTGRLGVWLDGGFDVVIQNAVMGAIGIGCFKMGLPLWVVILFMVSNAASNFVSFNYNATFGFDSDKGNHFFRTQMDIKPSLTNSLHKNLIDPTSSHIGLYIFTYRYFIVLGAITNMMPWCFVAMTFISTFRWFFMYLTYANYLAGKRFNRLLRTLSMLDEESDDFYKRV